MKLTTLLVSAVLALGVAAIDPEAGNDVEARDFSGESLNEFDARDEEEFDIRDDQDLDARGGYPKCKGSNVLWKKVDYDWKCVCTRKGEYYNQWKGCVCKDGYEYSDQYAKCIPKCKHYEVYNDKTGKCEKPFSCKGDNVEIVDNYGTKSCKCTREGEKYSKKHGCKCDDGYEFSDKYHKCIPVCKHYEEYNEKTGKCEKPFSCKGKNVEIVDEYGVKSCKCLREGETYSKRYGCKCDEGHEFSDKYNKCIPVCKDYEEYNEKTGKCEKPFSCKGKNVEIVDDYGVKSCKCLLEGQVYTKWHGCQCKRGEYFSKEYNKCIPKCSYGTKYNGHECAPICKGDHVTYKHDKCKCLKPGYFYDESSGCKPRCDGDAKWNGHECKCDYGEDYVKGTGCVSKCKTPAYFKKGHCVCPSKDQYYDKTEGCKDRCPAGTSYDWSKKECKCDTYGQVYDKTQKKCYTPCKGKHVELKWDNYEPTCVCTKDGYEYTKWGCKPTCKAPATLEYGTCKCPGDQKYDEHKGCYCPRGHKYDAEHERCYKPCGRNEKLIWDYGNPKCVCKDGYVPSKFGCQKKNGGGYY